MNAGQVVQLLSGGPKMTIRSVKQWQNHSVAYCQWFVGTELKEGDFPITSLKIVEELPRRRQVGGSEATGPDSWMR